MTAEEIAKSPSEAPRQWLKEALERDRATGGYDSLGALERDE